MKPLSLQDLKPEMGTFHLSEPNRSFTLRKFTLDDERWFEKHFGERAEAIFKEMNMEKLTSLVFRLLSVEDKEFFKEREFRDFDENGREITGKRGGVELLRSMVVGAKEKIEVLKALMQTIGLSRPKMDELIDEEEKKRGLIQGSAGGPSSIGSPANTDGAGTTSGP